MLPEPIASRIQTAIIQAIVRTGFGQEAVVFVVSEKSGKLAIVQ